MNTIFHINWTCGSRYWNKNLKQNICIYIRSSYQNHENPTLSGPMGVTIYSHLVLHCWLPNNTVLLFLHQPPFAAASYRISHASLLILGISLSLRCFPPFKIRQIMHESTARDLAYPPCWSPIGPHWLLVPKVQGAPEYTELFHLPAAPIIMPNISYWCSLSKLIFSWLFSIF